MDLQVPLNRLKFGHEDGDGINARVTGRDARVAELAANLHAQGQIENLIVKSCGDGFYSVANGNRRLAAFQMIHGEESSFAVNCTLHEVDETRAFEFSLTTAITAEQLHPVDQYEAFARLEERGKTDEEIARQYGLTEKQVRQALALGRLSPAVRQAWREGAIKADVAQAFTLALSPAKQEKIYDKLEKAHQLSAYAVKRELGIDSFDASKLGELLDFVGAEAYRGRGGEVTEDLFGTCHIISSPDLLKAMVHERLAAKCEQLRTDGWGWAEIESDLPRGARYWSQAETKPIYESDEEERVTKLRARLEEIEETFGDRELDAEQDRISSEVDAILLAVRGRSFDAKKRKKLGCIVDIEDGRLFVLVGIKKPDEVRIAGSAADDDGAAPASSAKASAKAPDEPEISQALLHRLSVQLTTAAATALIQDEQLALSVLLAAVGCYGDCGVKLSVNGLAVRGDNERGLLGAEQMDRALPLAMQLKPAERITLLAQIAANALDFQQRSLDEDDKHSGAIAICNALDPKLINPALRGAFDAKDYFGGISKALSLKAIEGALGPDLARQQAKNSKVEIVAFAVENVPPTGWLPVQLRAKGYDGPPVRKLKAIEGGKSKVAAKGAASTSKADGGRHKPLKRAASAKKVAKKKKR
jgi:ParB family transcriptional regulator, chromosome partitioning protein